MRKRLYSILLLALIQAVQGFTQNAEALELRMMFWNLENYFDYRNDSTSTSDAEFSSRGARHWTKRRFYAKTNAVAKTILWAAGQNGGLPDVVGVAEVENAFVLRRLVQATALHKTDYRIVHFDSPDPRGIDVALLYRSSRLSLLEARPCHIYTEHGVLPGRDILLCRFVTAEGEQELTVLVNHHPSKYGGAAAEPRRAAAIGRLAHLADSLLEAGHVRLVAMGDMNDTPDNPLYGRIPLRNLALEHHRHGEGTIKFDGAWEMIDMFFVSDSLPQADMSILRVPFLQAPDATHGGTKPLRTYSGPRYLGGVSDHCPVWLSVRMG